jgi:hypothetical protein
MRTSWRHGHAISRIQETPRIRIGPEQVHAAIVALVGLQTFKNLLRVMQDGQRRIEREIRAGFDARIVPAFALAVADNRHVIGEDTSEAGVRELGRAGRIGRGIGRRLNVEFQPHRAIGLVERNSRNPHWVFSRL